MDLPTTPIFERRAMIRATNERFLRLKEVMAMCGKCRSSIYAAMKKGEFPKVVKLRGRSSGWVKSEVDSWLQECIRARAHQSGTESDSNSNGPRERTRDN